MQIDANSKLGPSIIPGDPKSQSRNGRQLLNVINENSLVIVNGTDLCSGVITRFRKTTIRTEESVLDFFIVCERFLTFIKSMTIDIDRKYPLTKFSNKIGQKSVKVSDHNTLMLELNIRWNSGDMKEMRQEIFNFNNEDNFKRFEMLTESNDDLIQCFDKCDDLNLAANRWLKMVNNMIKKSFKKVRIKKQKINPELETLFAEKENIRSKISQLENEENADKVLDEMIRLDDQYEDTVDKIATICADKNRALVDEYLGRTEDTIEGFKQVKTWSLKKSLVGRIYPTEPWCIMANKLL